MSDLYQVSSAPHVRAKTSTSRIMLYVIIALMPTTIFGIWHFGWRALVVLLITVAAAVLSELVFDLITRRPLSITDLSCVVTGLLLGLNLPVSIPYWEAAIGSVFAIIVVKMLFGGLGQNFMNPALGARCFMLIAFASSMTNFSYNGYTGATPLAKFKADGGLNGFNVMNILTGLTGGTIGETCMFAIVIGAIILLLLGVITLRIPAAYIITFGVFFSLYLVFSPDREFSWAYLAAELGGGGLMLGAFFMATDYVTSPITPSGQIIYGIICGLLTGIFRCFGPNAEGVSFAIILSNLFVPIIERYTVPLASGMTRPKKEHKKKQAAIGKEGE